MLAVEVEIAGFLVVVVEVEIGREVVIVDERLSGRVVVGLSVGFRADYALYRVSLALVEDNRSGVVLGELKGER